MATPGAWLRPLTEGEQMFEMSQARHRHQITCYNLGMCSRAPLAVGAVEGALGALYRKVPHLRLCIREKDGKSWFREQEKQTLDFTVLSNTDVVDELEKQINTSLDSYNGPLWRVVMVPSHAGSPHLMEELALDFPYQCNILLTFHHGITDGFTTVRVCNLFLKLLNEIIQGQPIDEAEQLGEFNDGAETTRLITKRQQQLDMDPVRKERIVNAIHNISNYRPLMAEAFPVPVEQKRNATLSVTRQLTREDTRKLRTFFKNDCITLNSGFLAMANLSLVDMFKKRGFKKEMYEICSFNAVDFRRYWEIDSSRQFGCHFGPISLIIDTPSDSSHHFLAYAHDIQNIMQDYISNNRTFDECVFSDVKRGSNCKNFDEFFTNPPKYPQIFHSTTNMGDLSKSLPGEGEHVQISWLSRHNSFHRFNSTLLNALHTFRGRLTIGVDYNALNITAAVANEYIDNIIKQIHDIVKQMP